MSQAINFTADKLTATDFTPSTKRGQYFDIKNLLQTNDCQIDDKFLAALTKYDVIYRALCSILFNYVPNSGHPGGSISSGHIVHSLMFATMAYDFSNPDALDADQLCYAAGHKAMGLYAALALRNECVKIAKPDLLPKENWQLRLEDLLGFRRNPTSDTKLFKKYHTKALDGHPTPFTPFVKVTTGASGVGVTTAGGLAFAALDYFGNANCPIINVLEGEGGMTAGRVSEMLATLASAQINNFILHLDWNQAAIDTDNVCREGDKPGHYVQWTPAELAYCHDFNVINVADGFDFKQVLAAQYLAKNLLNNHQPTAIIYRTTKGWKYGIEGRKSHGAGHGFCSPEFYQSLAEFEQTFGVKFPRFSGDQCLPEQSEADFFACLMTLREVLAQNKELAKAITYAVLTAKTNLQKAKRKPRAKAPDLNKIYSNSTLDIKTPPPILQLKIGSSATHRGVLADTFGYLNKLSGGAVVAASADLFGSTSISNIAKDVQDGFYNAVQNPLARLIPMGGICEDAIGGFMSGVAAFGQHLGVGSSYAAFIAPLQHIAARLHAIGQEAKVHAFGGNYNPFVIVCAHVGPKTGEDGPTHADPQSLQLLSENFPKGLIITLTPWDTQEIWPLVAASLTARPAVIAPFVTRPSETVLDRAKFKLPPAYVAAQGVYAMRKADPKQKIHGSIVLQGNGVAQEFVTKVLPELDKRGVNLNIYYVTSAELFDRLPALEQAKIFPEEDAKQAMGITEFTLATMYRWVTSRRGREHTLHPFHNGHYLGSGSWQALFKEAGLDAEGQLAAILNYVQT